MLLIRVIKNNVSERANQSYDALRETLSAAPPPPVLATSPETKQRLASAVHPRILAWRDGQPQFTSPPSAPPEVQSASAAETLQLLLDRTKVW